MAERWSSMPRLGVEKMTTTYIDAAKHGATQQLVKSSIDSEIA